MNINFGVGRRRSCFASFQPLAAQHTSNRLNHDFALSSCSGSGNEIPLPVDVAMIACPAFRHQYKLGTTQNNKQGNQ